MQYRDLFDLRFFLLSGSPYKSDKSTSGCSENSKAEILNMHPLNTFVC
jgi:hypothetical protein